MDAKTLEALKASIAKWERNAVARTKDAYLVGCPNCALCIHILGPELDGTCDGCPVDDETGDSCSDTPYDDAHYAHKVWNRDAGKKAREAARKEVAFLKSLLPPEEQVP